MARGEFLEAMRAIAPRTIRPGSQATGEQPGKNGQSVVFAHELGHSVRRHVMRTIIRSSLLTPVGLYLCSLAVPPLAQAAGTTASAVGALPIYALVLTLFGTITRPIDLAFSRLHEREADWFALEKTANPQAFKRAFERMARLAKGDPTPPRRSVILFSSHPPIGERMAMGERWAAEHQPANH